MVVPTSLKPKQTRELQYSCLPQKKENNTIKWIEKNGRIGLFYPFLGPCAHFDLPSKKRGYSGYMCQLSPGLRFATDPKLECGHETKRPEEKRTCSYYGWI